MALTLISSVKCFGGWLHRYKHDSVATSCSMTFSVYLPPAAETRKVPVLWYLSGLTCTDENVMMKSGAQRDAARHEIALVAPDTSPRGCNIEGESESWDFGLGAGFYVNATEPKWSKNYRMYEYVTKELPQLVVKNFPIIEDRQSITGHSMGGHGALICALKNPGKYKEYDATHLISKYQGPDLHILIDQGLSDKFLVEQLKPENLIAAGGNAITYRGHKDYDHSYYFVSTFIPDHFDHHAKFLKE